MTTEDVEMVDESQPPPPFPTVRILQVVKEAQQQHGLRHGDYARYRKYCASKLNRLRRALKFTNTHKCVRRHKAKFVKKWVVEDTLAEERFILIAVFEAERRWAQAMADKITVESNPDATRKHHTVKMNLRRAVLHAKHLEEIVRNNARCDAPTKLETQAYALWLVGVCSFESKQWAEATEALKAAQAVYEGLAEATLNTSASTIYSGKCREIIPQLRLCKFNMEETGSLSEIMAISLQIGGGADVDKLIAEVRSKASRDDVVTVEWAAQKFTVEDDKAKQVIHVWRQAAAELAQCESPKEKMALYEKQLSDTRDAIDRLSDLIRRKTSENADSLDLKNIKTYLEFLKMCGTASRYLAMIESTQNEKKTKPQDLLRLYDSVIEIYKEILELPGAEENLDLQKGHKAKVEYYKAFRCYYMACAYSALGRFAEAEALFTRAQKRATEAATQVSSLASNQYLVSENKANAAELCKNIESSRMVNRATRTSQAAGISAVDDKTAAKIDERPLLETLDEWRSWNITQCLANKTTVPIAKMPPSFISMPNKPVFLDIAFNHIKMPDVAAHIEKSKPVPKAAPTPSKDKKAGTAGNAANKEEGSGLMGWFWGKK